MLRWRLIIGISIIASLAALCYWDLQMARGGIVLVPLALLVALAATEEMLGLFAARGTRLIAWPVYLATLAPVAAACAPLLWETYPMDCPIGKTGWLALGTAAGLITLLCGEMRHYAGPGQVTTRLAHGALTVVYVGLLLGFLIQLRLIEFPTATGEPDRRWGMAALLSTIVAVKMCDTGAYTVGRLIGKHKMAPRVSPGKTWEGMLGGLAFAGGGTWAVKFWLLPAMGLSSEISSLRWILFGVAIGAAGVLGDLAESLLKRDAGQKDSSRWMPGFGGVLDIFDSLLIAAPVAYLCWISRLIGP